jgi:hypothetical protein
MVCANSLAHIGESIPLQKCQETLVDVLNGGWTPKDETGNELYQICASADFFVGMVTGKNAACTNQSQFPLRESVCPSYRFCGEIANRFAR